jgi:hypothetical protein
MRTLISAILILAVLIGGCKRSTDDPFISRNDLFSTELADESNMDSRDAAAGIIEHLQSQQLPPVRSIAKWHNGYGDGIIITTDHYRIYTTLLEPLMLAQIPGFMESAYKGYQAQLPRSVRTTSKFTIYLFAQRSQWESFTDIFAGENATIYKKISSGAYCLKGSCVAYNIGRSKTLSILGHEGWHQFNSKHFIYRLPSWLDEGIATQFEAYEMEDGFFIFKPPANLNRLGPLKTIIARNKTIPLKQLITMSPGQVLADSSESVKAFYSQSYALVRFLREGNYGGYLRSYHEMLDGGILGQWPFTTEQSRIASDRNIQLTAGFNRVIAESLFKHYITTDIDSLQNEYLLFSSKITQNVKPVKAGLNR